MGHLSFRSPVSSVKRMEMFQAVIHLLARRYKMPVAELRWVLKQEGDFTNKRYHFHFLLDGSNLSNKDVAKLAVNFGKLWEKAGGGNHDVRPYAIELDPNGYQRAVNYLTKVEGFRVPFSKVFDAGENCHLKFSEAMDRHIAAVCTDSEPQKKDTQ